MAGLADDYAAQLTGPEPAPVRLAYAAAHVVMLESYIDEPDDLSGTELEAHIDWEATRAQRRRLAAHGFAVAEAMDTAQRFELGWDISRRLIEDTGALDLPHGFVAGAGADGVTSASGPALVDRVVEQATAIRSAGGEVIVLPLTPLAVERKSAADYERVYDAILTQLEPPVFLHWLGPMFAPELEGYFPGDSFERIVARHAHTVRGVKLSLLDAAREVRLRRELLVRDQIVLTGDDLHFAGLMQGAGGVLRHTRIGTRDVALGDFSHALLGVFDAIAAPAGLALRLLARNRVDGYRALLEPCERLGQALFEPPVAHYKAGLAFLAWLNGHQPRFSLPRHAERRRDLDHYLRVAQLASEARVIEDAPLAALRLESLRADPETWQDLV